MTTAAASPVAPATPAAPVTPPPTSQVVDPTPPPAGGAAAQSSAANEPFYKTLPADWREQIATGLNLDEGKKNMLGRYQSFDKFTEAFFHAQDKIRSGEAKTPPTLPENPTPEQLAEYRTKVGLPTTVDDYKISPPQGVTATEQDQRIIDAVRQYAFENNLKPDVANNLLAVQFKAREQELQAAINQHGIDKQTATRQLRETWGSDFETNNNMVNNLLSGLPSNVQESVLGAQLADGRMLFNSPEVMVWLADLARAVNPAATVLPNSNNPVAGIAEEIKQLESRMGTPEWYRDDAAQKRYQQLVVARENIAKQQGR